MSVLIIVAKFLSQKEQNWYEKDMEVNRNRKKTVLVVDDEKDVRETLRMQLEDGEFKVMTAKDGEDAIDALKRHDISLVIADIKMPKLDGFGLLNHIREYYSFIPVIMLTGYIDVDIAVDAMKKGSFDYITKPVRRNELIATVNDVLMKSERAKDTQSFQVSQVYLLTEGVTVIFHKDLSMSSRFDSDIFGSMLTAVRMFIEDSFHKSGKEAKSFEYGNSRILIEDGDGFFLAAIGEGEDTTFARSKMKRAIKRIERKYGDTIPTWLGDMEVFEEIEIEFADLLSTEDSNGEIASQSISEPFKGQRFDLGVKDGKKERRKEKSQSEKEAMIGA